MPLAPITKPDGSVWDFPPSIEMYGVASRDSAGVLRLWPEVFGSREDAARAVFESVKVAERSNSRRVALTVVPIRVSSLSRVMVSPGG